MVGNLPSAARQICKHVERHRSVDQTSPYLGAGVYRLIDAARLAEVPAARARAWVRGYAIGRTTDGSPPTRRPALLGSRLPDSPEGTRPGARVRGGQNSRRRPWWRWS